MGPRDDLEALVQKPLGNVRQRGNFAIATDTCTGILK